MKQFIALSAVIFICLSPAISSAQKKNSAKSSGTLSNQAKTTKYYWAGVIQKQGMTAYQYGTHNLKGKSLSGEPNEPETTFALKSKKINLNKFIGKKVIITGKKIEGYPLESGPEFIDVSAVEPDKKVKMN